MYLLLFLKRDTIFLIPNLVNKIIYTKLPDLLWDSIGKLMAVITSQISHGPYSLNNNPKALYIVYKIPIALLIY
jgi:hypothetical protein